MGLFAALKGDVLHFNSNAVPVVNRIFGSVDALGESREKEILLRMVATGARAVDLLFNPEGGLIRSRVKNFNQDDFQTIYEVVILFLILSVSSGDETGVAKLKEMFKNATGRSLQIEALHKEMEELSSNDELLFRFVWKRVTAPAGIENKQHEILFAGMLLHFFNEL